MKEEKEKQSSMLQRNPEEKVANEERSEVPSATEKSHQESIGVVCDLNNSSFREVETMETRR